MPNKITKRTLNEILEILQNDPVLFKKVINFLETQTFENFEKQHFKKQHENQQTLKKQIKLKDIVP